MCMSKLVATVTTILATKNLQIWSVVVLLFSVGHILILNACFAASIQYQLLSISIGCFVIFDMMRIYELRMHDLDNCHDSP